MKKILGKYICIENEYPQGPDDNPEVEPLFDIERGYRKGDVFEIFFDDGNPTEKYPFTLTGIIEYKKYPRQLCGVYWKINRASFNKHFVHLRKAKLEKLKSIW
jgi:hypothetical protein